MLVVGNKSPEFLTSCTRGRNRPWWTWCASSRTRPACTAPHVSAGSTGASAGSTKFQAGSAGASAGSAGQGRGYRVLIPGELPTAVRSSCVCWRPARSMRRATRCRSSRPKGKGGRGSVRRDRRHPHLPPHGVRGAQGMLAFAWEFAYCWLRTSVFPDAARPASRRLRCHPRVQPARHVLPGSAASTGCSC